MIEYITIGLLVLIVGLVAWVLLTLRSATTICLNCKKRVDNLRHHPHWFICWSCGHTIPWDARPKDDA